MQFHFSLVIISHLYLTCLALWDVPFNVVCMTNGPQLVICQSRRTVHHTNTALQHRLHGTGLQHGKHNQVLPHCKAMLISPAIKTFRLINKEKEYKRKECQTEGEEEEGESQTVTYNRKECGRPNTMVGVLNMLLSVCGVIWVFISVCECLCLKQRS